MYWTIFSKEGSDIKHSKAFSRLAIFLSAFAVLLAACSSQRMTPTESVPFDTLVAQTVAAYQTEQASRTPIFTPTTPISTPIPTATPSPTPVRTEISHSCDKAVFLGHITFEPLTQIEGGMRFVKSWQVRNAGRCTWTTGYALQFVSGSTFGAPMRIPLDRIVPPDGVIDFSVRFTSPIVEGIYTGKWALINDDNNEVPILNIPDNHLVVTILVKDLDEIALDFTDDYCEARWESLPEDQLPCPGKYADTDSGYVLIEEDGELENGNAVTNDILVTRPDSNDVNGYIQGIYPEIEIQKGDHFAATIGCAPGAIECDLIFDLQYQFVGGSIQTLASWREIYDERVREISLDLSPLVGDPVRLILRVRNNGTDQDNEGYWYEPVILR